MRKPGQAALPPVLGEDPVVAQVTVVRPEHLADVHADRVAAHGRARVLDAGNQRIPPVLEAPLPAEGILGEVRVPGIAHLQQVGDVQVFGPG